MIEDRIKQEFRGLTPRIKCIFAYEGNNREYEIVTTTRTGSSVDEYESK